MRLISLLDLLVIALVTALFSSRVHAEDISAEAAQEIQALLEEKAARTPAQRKVSSQLIYAAKQRRGEPLARGVGSLQLLAAADANNGMLVDIAADVTPQVLTGIVDLGGTVISNFPPYRAIRAWLPIDALESLAALPDVTAIRPAARPMHRKRTTSEGDTALRADLARSTFGVNGSGVTIGVLSDSVDGLAAVQGSGDLGSLIILPGQSGIPGSGEGTAMLEIVYDLAPGASLVFATATESEAGMATNIQALRDAGCDIIVDDVGYSTEPVFQDGIIAAAVNTVTAGGALYFSAAGNGGNLDHRASGVWEGDFVASASLMGADVLHSFGSTTLDTITGEPDSLITLQWSDPFGASANDYDLFLLNLSGTHVVAASTDVQDGSGDPLEIIDTSQFFAQGFRLAIGKASGEARYLHLDTNGGMLALSTAGEIWGHPTAVDAFAVAAVSADGRTTPFTGGAANPVESFSSDGPRRMFYQADGTPITPGNFSSTGGSLRQKPDIAAADGVKVSVPGFTPFFGTSAAAPHAAAIAALVKSANPALTPNQIRTALMSSALDIETPGFDRDSGAGVLNAFAAVQAVLPSPVATPTADANSPTPSPLAPATATPTLPETPSPTPQTPSATPVPMRCIGDCDASGTVTVNEIIALVDITLGTEPPPACASGIPDGAEVDVTLIVRAVDNALTSCAPT